MTNEEVNIKLKGFIGLCHKAGRVVCGTDLVCDSIRSGKSKIVLVSIGASDNAKKRIFNCCRTYECECSEVYLSIEDLSGAIGKLSSVVTIGITDVHMVKGIKKILDLYEV